MTSPPRDTVATSPISIHGKGSPILRRRGSTHSSDHAGESSSRARHSPTLTRNYDPEDPHSRERQRTMDADMAIQLSRARRETVSSPITQNTPPMSQPAVSPIVPFSPHEQREIDIARGHVTSEGLILQDHIDDSAAHMDHSQTDSSTIDFRSHLSQNHDPNLLATSHLPPNHELHSGGLPAYQATSNVSQFDFSMMEAYAADEKTRLGVSPRFVLSPPHRPRPDPTSESAVDDQPEASEPGPSDRTRQRKLSQSAPVPRPSRKGIGAKLALFESHANEPLPARIGMLLGQSSANNDSEPSLNAPAPNYYQTGHDRPYRFSFYSNALSATIHSRSLSELPFEGQTFEQLFAGIGGSTGTTPHPGNPNGGSNVNNNGPSRAGTRDGAGRPESILKRPGATSDDYFMPGTPKAGTPGLPATKDADAGTWWLDVTSPTDEEMKMLSKVRHNPTISFHTVPADTSVGLQHTSLNDGRYPDGGNSREDRAFQKLLLCLFPEFRPGSVQPYLPRASQHVYHRFPRRYPICRSSLSFLLTIVLHKCSPSSTSKPHLTPRTSAAESSTSRTTSASPRIGSHTRSSTTSPMPLALLSRVSSTKSTASMTWCLSSRTPSRRTC